MKKVLVIVGLLVSLVGYSQQVNTAKEFGNLKNPPGESVRHRNKEHRSNLVFNALSLVSSNDSYQRIVRSQQSKSENEVYSGSKTSNQDDYYEERYKKSGEYQVKLRQEKLRKLRESKMNSQ